MKLVSIHIQIIFILLISAFSLQAQQWTLDQCLDSAHTYNQNLQIHRNNILLQQNKEKEIAAQRWPKVNIGADYKYFINLPYQLMPMSLFGGPEGQFKEAQFGVPHNINASIQLMMPVYNPQIKNGQQIARTAEKMNELQYWKSEEELFFEIANLYYNTQILYQHKSFIEKNIRNSQQLLGVMQSLYEHQMALKTDVSKIELQIAQLHTKQDQVESQISQLLNALRTAIGLPAGIPFDIPTEITQKTAISYSPQVSLDYQLAQTQRQMLMVELEQIKDSRLPTVSLTGSYGLTGFGYDKNPDPFLKIYPMGFLGVQATYPLFDGTISKHKINQKNIELTNNQLKMNLIKDQNSMLIENAILQRQITLNAIQDMEAQITQAQSVYDQTLAQHQQEIASLTEIIQADYAITETQQSYISAVVDFLKADLELRKLTGHFVNHSNQ